MWFCIPFVKTLKSSVDRILSCLTHAVKAFRLILLPSIHLYAGNTMIDEWYHQQVFITATLFFKAFKCFRNIVVLRSTKQTFTILAYSAVFAKVYRRVKIWYGLLPGWKPQRLSSNVSAVILLGTASFFKTLGINVYRKTWRNIACCQFSICFKCCKISPRRGTFLRKLRVIH